MSKDEPITAEMVEKVRPGEKVEALLVEWDGETWEVPPSLDKVSYVATVAYAELAASAAEDDRSIVPLVHLDAFIAAVLGQRQYRRLVKGRDVERVNGLVTVIMNRWGALDTGE